MAAARARFCEHGNLPYSCAKCREERRARWASKTPRLHAPRALDGGRIPARPWSLDAPLPPAAQDALRAIDARAGGVVRMPSMLGLREVAAALLASLRHRHTRTVLLVPGGRAAESWDRFLTERLHVPPGEVDASGRAVRDWARAPPLVILAPDGATRNIAGLRAIARDATLVVDSPDAAAYEDHETLFRTPFAFRSGFMAARLAPPPENVWPRLDALGGIAFDHGVATAMREGHLRSIRVGTPVVARLDAATIAAAATEGLGKGRVLIYVDDAEAGRRVEERLSRDGVVPRFVGGAASDALAERSGRALAEGGAQALVTTPDAPQVPLGPVDRLVFGSYDMTERRAEQAVLAQLAPAGRRLEVVLPVPAEAPADPAAARLAVARLALLAHLGGATVPALPWLAEASGLPLLAEALVARLRERAGAGWQAVLGFLPELLEGHDEPAAVAALADHYVAARLDVAPIPLGPPPRDVRTLLGADAAGMRLSALALYLHEAQRAFGDLLRGDLVAFRESYAGAPILHHLAPDPRALLVATLERLRASDVPHLEAHDARGGAETIERVGPRLPSFGPPGPSRVGAPLSAALHMERLLAALEAERAHEEETSLAEIERVGDAERIRRGRTVVALELLGRERAATGAALRFGLPNVAGRERSLLPYNELTPGTVVDLSGGRTHDPVMRGTVANVTAREVHVIVEESKERRAPGRDVRIDVVGNPKVYEQLARAVRRVYGAGGVTPLSSGLRGYLLLETAGTARDAVEARLFDTGIDASQREAVANALGATRLALVHGPPGTGKTTTLVEVIRQEAARGHRVLVTADSNAAVDNVLDACLKAGLPGVRTGPLPSLTRPHLAPFHVDELRERAPGVDWLRRLPVVFTTHVSSGALPDDLTFDVVVQDEASQATEPASLLSLQRAPRAVLAGDHLQLPPVVQSREAEALGLGVSLFERLHGSYGASHGSLLTMQYRMHPDIVAWSNQAFYGGRIETAVDPPPVAAAVGAGLLPGSPRAVFVDVTGRETTRHTSKEREAEAAWIDRFVRAALAAGVVASDVAVIAAYRAQMRLLRRLLEDTGVDVGTIDAFQGSERDLVVVSLVRSNVAGEVGFVREPRRLNVAVTRARRHLVVVGDGATLGNEPLLRSLMETLGRLPA